jgi:ATP-binding cassette subfamily B protein
MTLASVAWPLDRLGDGLELLARHSGLAPDAAELPRLPQRAQTGGPDELAPWVEALAQRLGLEAERVSARYAETRELLERLGPGVVLLREPEVRLGMLLPAARRRLRLLAPSGAIVTVAVDELAAALTHQAEAPARPQVDALRAAAGVAEGARPRARQALLDEWLSEAEVGPAWVVRPAPGRSFWRELRLAGVPHKLVTLLGAHAAQYLLFLVAWWMLGAGALTGRLDQGWLWAWALVLLSLVPIRLLEFWSQGMLSLRVARALKQRLLVGALRTDPDRIRNHGVGQLLGRVFEAEAIEALALGGGVATLVAAIELVVAAVVLGLGAGGLLHALLLGGWCVVVVALAQRFFTRLLRWTNDRRDLTSDLVERMIGHRTRLAQEPRAEWHTAEDQALSRYVGVAAESDASLSLIVAAAPRGWLVLALIGLGPAFIAGGSGPGMAIALGGSLLALRAFSTLTQGLGQLASAAVVWRQVAELYRAAERAPAQGDPVVALAPARPDAGGPLLDARELVFRYPSAGEPVLRGASLSIARGDRVLLEGPSGGGKSTLGALLAGLRTPQAGLLLLEGADRHSLGERGWRSRVVFAPQFHENHLLTASLAFNLLMGRGWPPTDAEFRDAERLCEELGLGPVLARMPAGMQQMVGESGWQLSHGEKSRLYIARAL